MSVTVLYCEGNSKSIDIRVIRQLLPKCDIRPVGGKSLIPSSIIADRRRNQNLACLVDRDFDCRDRDKSDTPVKLIYEQQWAGWSWSRKEIENYLIDLVVVKKASGKNTPDPDEYQNALNQAAESIAAYSAARTALSCEKFINFWGEEVRKGHYFPRKLGKDSCLVKIGEIVRENKGDRMITEEDVTHKFKALLTKFRPGGARFADYLSYFAGKDLLFAMREKLRTFGFEPPPDSNWSPEQVFLEKIVNKMERLDQVWQWLPEWTTLRQLIENTNFSDG
ncbi:MAG: hypothetical protein Fur0025_00520 [Oscillatoriaceae cyanobacterium]